MRVAFTKQAAPAGVRLKQHSMARGMRRSVRDTMLRDVNSETRAEPSRESFPFSAARNLLHAEICSVGIFAMQQCGGDPNFVRHFQQLLGLSGHGDAPI